ncbi:hypothetical protein ABZV65_19695 [Streptomyces bauhiniae]|uniref:hypothetical protein n=1 Tax=Streptomyces bauhiniae TaxID=2340725 RepID=UPI0033AFCDE6
MADLNLPPAEGPEYTPCACSHIEPGHAPNGGGCYSCDCEAYRPAAPVLVSPPPDRAALRDRVAAAARTVSLRLGPNALAMAERGEPIILSGGEADMVADAVLAVLPESGRAATLLDAAEVCICGHAAQQHFEDVCITEITGCDCGDFMTPEAAREVIARWQRTALTAEERATAMERAMESTAADALKHRGCHRDLMAQCLRAERAEAELRRLAAEAPQPDIEAHEPLHWWRVEILDGTRWKPESSPFSARANAAIRCAFRNERMPVWPDGTLVQRRIVPVATTYTVEQGGAEARPRRGDQFEAWLKAQRDLYDRTDQREESSEFWHEFDRALDLYRLHADTGTPLGEHVCEGRVAGDCECLEQPDAEAPTLARLADADPEYREVLLKRGDEMTAVSQPAADGGEETQICRCSHSRAEHVKVSGRLLCDACDPDNTNNRTCEEFEAL